MTLQGTQTYIVGRAQCVVIDPGPDSDEHLDAIAREVSGGVSICILVTHAHPDHDAGARRLAARLKAEIRSGELGLKDGDVIPTDDGDLLALHTPGHTPDHFSFWWPTESSIFCGDLMMGGLDTALVAPPEGDLGDYLASLARLAGLGARVIYPAHGPPITDPLDALDRYRRHRLDREAQVLAGLEGKTVSAEQLTDRVYGSEIDPGLRPYARAAIDAYLAHLEKMGRVRRGKMGWERFT